MYKCIDSEIDLINVIIKKTYVASWITMITYIDSSGYASEKYSFSYRFFQSGLASMIYCVQYFLQCPKAASWFAYSYLAANYFILRELRNSLENLSILILVCAGSSDLK